MKLNTTRNLHIGLTALIMFAVSCKHRLDEAGQGSPVNKFEGSTALPEGWRPATGLLSKSDRENFARLNEEMGYELSARTYVKTEMSGTNNPVEKITREELQIIEKSTGNAIATSQFERIPLIDCNWDENKMAESRAGAGGWNVSTGSSSRDWEQGIFVGGRLIGIAQTSGVRGYLCRDDYAEMKMCKGYPNKSPVRMAKCTVKKGADGKVIHIDE